MSEAKYVVILEKKGRGRGLTLVRPWAVRTFKLNGQNFDYYDGERMKGTLNTAGCVAKKIPSAEADNKEFPFTLDTGKEKVLLNASSEEIREKSIEILMLSSTTPAWDKLVGKKPLSAAEASAKAAAEAKRLEEERKQNVAGAAAAQLSEQLADQKLRQAKEAEKEQHVEQEKQVTELFKGMGAKQKFYAALKSGNKPAAKEAAALMLQGAWRSKCARRRMVIKKAEKERLKRDGYARKIQCRYRARLARRRVKQIKAEQQRRLEMEFNKSISKQRGIIRIQTLMRIYLSKKRALDKRKYFSTVVKVEIHGIEGVNYSDPNHADPFAYVNGLVLLQPAGRAVPLEVLKGGKVTSQYRTESLNGKDSTSAESALATSLNLMDYVVVTVVDGKDDFLGQVAIRLSEHPGLFKQKSVLLTLPLQNYAVPIVYEEKATNAVPVNVRKQTTGTITLSITIPDPAYTVCGWVWKVSESILSNAWKRRWFVLKEGRLHYYNSDLCLEQSKNFIDCREVKSIERELVKGRNGLTVSTAQNYWNIDFDEDEARAIVDAWTRKLYRNCPGVEDPTLSGLSVSVHKTKLAGDAVSPKGGPKRVPVSKRMSIFK